jgi:hypothetical protein
LECRNCNKTISQGELCYTKTYPTADPDGNIELDSWEPFCLKCKPSGDFVDLQVVSVKEKNRAVLIKPRCTNCRRYHACSTPNGFCDKYEVQQL